MGLLLLIWPVLIVRRGCPIWLFSNPTSPFISVLLPVLLCVFLRAIREMVLRDRQGPGERCPLGAHSSALGKTMERIKIQPSDTACALTSMFEGPGSLDTFLSVTLKQPHLLLSRLLQDWVPWDPVGFECKLHHLQAM